MTPTVVAQLDGGIYRGPRPPVSIVILTFNEKDNIADTIRSCAWSDDVHVLDSGSTDGTIDIARSLGVKVHHNPFKSFGQQRNWAIDNIPCKHPWHFHLDADERFTPELIHELLATLGPDGNATNAACFQCPSKMIFMGKWLKRSGGYPTYQVRLFRFGLCRFVDFGHGQREDPTGPTLKLQHPYMHYAFSKGLNEWLHKHNGYSDREAREGLEHWSKTQRPGWGALLQRDPVARRRAAKDMFYFLRFRALVRFGYAYLLRLGLLDGRAGFHYCAMIAMYEYWIELKMREAKQDWIQRTNDKVLSMTAEDERRVAGVKRPDIVPLALPAANGTPASPAPAPSQGGDA